MKMRSIGVAFMAGTFALFHTATIAQEPAEPVSYLTADRMISDIKAGSDLALIILNSYALQTMFINAELDFRGSPRFYCPPVKLAITPEQNADILERYVKNHEDMGQFPAGAVLLDALMEVFPCGTPDQ